MKQIVLGTAGHIDHGKTSLIKALTNIDTDRLKEEKERGITIDLGFAFLNLTDDIQLGILADAAEKAGAPADYVTDLRARPCGTLGHGTGEL